MKTYMADNGVTVQVNDAEVEDLRDYFEEA